MPEISRRNALIVGGAGIASVAVGGTGFFINQGRSSGSTSGTVAGKPLVEPTEFRSADGLLSVDLETAPQRVTIAGRDVNALSYNGGVPGPTLRVRAGDTLTVNLKNGLTDPSNLHVHGLHVSPEGNSYVRHRRGGKLIRLPVRVACRSSPWRVLVPPAPPRFRR